MARNQTQRSGQLSPDLDTCKIKLPGAIRCQCKATFWVRPKTIPSHKPITQDTGTAHHSHLRSTFPLSSTCSQQLPRLSVPRLPKSSVVSCVSQKNILFSPWWFPFWSLFPSRLFLCPLFVLLLPAEIVGRRGQSCHDQINLRSRTAPASLLQLCPCFCGLLSSYPIRGGTRRLAWLGFP